MRHIVWAGLVFFLSGISSGLCGPLNHYFVHFNSSPFLLPSAEVRIGIQETEDAPVGDILFLPGFADRYDNHLPLFEAWADAGFRVISFDYPSHGETQGSSINFFTFRKLAELARKVEGVTRANPNRPLILAGWSTGGLLATRLEQAITLRRLGRRPQGLILFTPGISVYPVVGEPSFEYPLGEVTTSSLTHDPKPPHFGEIHPRSPGSVPLFGGYLLFNSWLSRMQSYPRNLPTLVFVADSENDRYANSKGVKRWMSAQDQDPAVQIYGVSVPGARHEVDNETPEFGGPAVRKIAAEFAKNVLTRRPQDTSWEVSPCTLILKPDLPQK